MDPSQSENLSGASATTTTAAATTTTSDPTRPLPPLKRELKPRAQPIPVHPHAAHSPSRLRSSSPMMHSPASSEIFERNVQEPATISTLQGELSPAHIPSHVITEDHIPPALEASAQAITSEELNPDDVEIVTSTAHQPAGASVLDMSSSHGDLPSLASPMHSPPLPSPPTLQHQASEDSDRAGFHSLTTTSSFPAEDDTASNYGQLDPTDVRRLSFISFKDIVQSEHQQQQHHHHQHHLAASLDSLPPPDGPSAASTTRASRSGLATPPPPPSATAPTFAPLSPATTSEQSPARAPASALPLHGELAIETLGQALRKTASGDLGSGRGGGALAMSPTSEHGHASHLGVGRSGLDG